MSKSAFYRLLNEQVSAIIGDETDSIANMANISALLFEQLERVNWVGFYRLIDETLVLGPFQGKVACIRIPVGKGVCGTAVSESATQLVEDVHAFAGHIACDAASNSEIVVPVYHKDKIVAVLDIDSPEIGRFDEEDKAGIEAVVKSFEKSLAQ